MSTSIQIHTCENAAALLDFDVSECEDSSTVDLTQLQVQTKVIHKFFDPQYYYDHDQELDYSLGISYVNKLDAAQIVMPQWALDQVQTTWWGNVWV